MTMVSRARHFFWIFILLLLLSFNTIAQPGPGEIDPDAYGAVVRSGIPRTPPQAISTGKCAAPLSDTSQLISEVGTGFDGNDLSHSPLTDVFFGFNSTQGQYIRAEEFYVPRGAIWQPDEVTFYAYATGNYTAPPEVSITGIHDLSLWDAAPDSDGARLLATAATSGSIVSNMYTGVYRVNEVVPSGVTRPIFATTIEWPFDGLGALGPGDYWITWSISAQIGLTPVTVFVPQLSVPSASDNARDRQLPAGAWQTSPTGGVPSRSVTLPLTVCGTTVPTPPTGALPVAPDLWKPVNGFPLIGGPSPLLLWYENSYADRVLTYQVVLKRSSDSTTLFNRYYAPDSICDVTAMCRVDLASLPIAREVIQLTTNGDYKWFVRATNSLGRTRSEQRLFSFDFPGTPGLIAPNGVYVAAPTELEWTSVAAASEYKVKIKSGGVTLYNSGWLPWTAFLCDPTHCLLHLQAQAGITPALEVNYKWQVQARNPGVSPASSKSDKALFRVIQPTVTPTSTMTPTPTPTFIDTVTPTPSNTPIP
jgi:hypothetical protein